jgi:hypothetical protein
MNTRSQAGQDLFFLKALNYKKNGTFLEIGSNHPITHNNTYIAESEYNWKGIMVEYDTSFAPMYTLYRPKSIHVLNDACKVDYRSLLDTHAFPTNMDYLQIDLDVNNGSTRNVVELLDKSVFDKYTFAAITFEHDIYTGDYFNTRQISRDIFKKRGYTLVFSDVSVFWEGSYKAFEDWYIHPSLVPNFKFSGENLSHEVITKMLDA